MPNIGEEDEINVLKNLVSLKGKTIPCLGLIESVADYTGKEFLNNKTVLKAPANSKRDVMINGVGYSLKSTRAAPAAIVNHTTREKWIRVCENLNLDIRILDEMVSEYWELRINGQIGEDIWTYDKKCPFGNSPERLDYLRELITYFLFEGTGSQDNPYPAEFVIEIEDPNDVNTWKVLNKETAFDKMWPNMKFSLRASKGMPPDYPNMKNISKKKKIEPWVRFINERYRGALHIRAARSINSEKKLRKGQYTLFDY